MWNKDEAAGQFDRAKGQVDEAVGKVKMARGGVQKKAYAPTESAGRAGRS